jgi:hypothetical protein
MGYDSTGTGTKSTRLRGNYEFTWPYPIDSKDCGIYRNAVDSYLTPKEQK